MSSWQVPTCKLKKDFFGCIKEGFYHGKSTPPVALKITAPWKQVRCLCADWGPEDSGPGNKQTHAMRQGGELIYNPENISR